MRHIKLATGAEVVVDRCGAADGVLWIGFPGGTLTLFDAVRIFSDAEATQTIVMSYDFDGMEETFVGYTECIYAAVTAEDKRVLIALRKVAE